ncbi:hypothetical protein GQ44DRAFT_779226 [Phaeosphaeriaceae sp. PMI808]|nr:hypothetical protein GQ44DRAFT_779226 [Phaeosphaeriaceae sp. PMI808]
MSKTLKRDMYSLGTLGYPAEQIKPPDPDLLAVSYYSCVYWVDYLQDANIATYSIYTNILKFFLFCITILGLLGGTLLVSFLKKHFEIQDDLRDDGTVHTFLKEKHLYWLEAIGLCNSMLKGVMLIVKLEVFMPDLPTSK